MRGFDSRHPLQTSRRRSQVVRQGSAKAPFPSSNLGVASFSFYMAVRSSSRSESNRWGALIVGGLLLTILAVAILSSVIAKRQLDEAAREQVAITVAQERVDDLLRAQLDEESALREALAARRAGGDPYIEMEDPFIPLTSVLEAELRGIDVPQALALTS